jgi:hypothetical protein
VFCLLFFLTPHSKIIYTNREKHNSQGSKKMAWFLCYSLNFHPIGQRGIHERLEAIIHIFPKV